MSLSVRLNGTKRELESGGSSGEVGTLRTSNAMDSQGQDDPQEDPVVARWVECADCGWKTQEYGPHEEIPVITTCPYCTYGGDMVVKMKTASEALAKMDLIGGIGGRPVSSPDKETEDARSGGD
jgi:hypothetical protein